MKPSNILVVGLVSYFAIKAFAKKGAAEKLQFFVNKVSIRFSGLTPVLDVVLGIHNPTAQTLRLGSIVGDLYINSSYAATISGYQLTDIKSMGISYFPISARLSLSGLYGEVSEIIRAITNGERIYALANQVISFKGYVNAEGFTFPLKFEYKVL